MAFQGDSIYWVEVEKIVPNPFQPRREFDQNRLQELADSIRMYGVLQPLTVTRKEIQREDGTFYSEYELIAGERRLRASKLAGVAQVPVIIREGEQSEQEKLELAIIENLQREDLNAVDRAIAFRQLSEQFGLSHGQVAQKVGRSREYVSNSIRLLGLPAHMLDSLKRAEMMEGHARTLLMLTDRPEEQEVVYREILLKKLSVREVERIVRKIATDKVRKKTPGEFDATLIEFEKKFTETLGTRVQILKTDFGGKLTIDYFSEDDLETILRRINDETKQLNNANAEAVTALAAATPLALTVEEKGDAPDIPIMSQVTPAVVAHYAEPETWSEVVFPSTESRRPELEMAFAHLLESPEESEESIVPESVATETTEVFPTEQPTPDFFAQQPEPVAPVVSPLVPKEEEPEADESDLYSIRNFSV
jgi:ParB family chromosome partitioning protein